MAKAKMPGSTRKHSSGMPIFSAKEAEKVDKFLVKLQEWAYCAQLKAESYSGTAGVELIDNQRRYWKHVGAAFRWAQSHIRITSDPEEADYGGA